MFNYWDYFNALMGPVRCEHCGEDIPRTDVEEHSTLVRAQKLLADVVDVSPSPWQVQLKELRSAIRENPEWVEHYGDPYALDASA